MNDEFPDPEFDVLECFLDPKYKIENGHVVEFDLSSSWLNSLPESIGNIPFLEHMGLAENLFTSLLDCIVHLSWLKYLDLDNYQITSFHDNLGYRRSLNELNLLGIPIKSLSNISKETVRYLRISEEFLTAKGIKLIEEKNCVEFLAYYRKSPTQLALEYISEPNSLTEDEKGRLIHEAGKIERETLENALPVDDPILRTIIESDSLEISNGL